MRVVAGAMLLAVLGCGGSEPPPAPPASTSTTHAPAVQRRPAPVPTVPASQPTTSSTVAGLTTPEDARRLLEQRGIDPGRLSEEVGEHMRRRFTPPAE